VREATLSTLHDGSFISMTVENVEQCEVRTIDSSDLIVVVISMGAPRDASRKVYALTD
jgi:hypothetical protein